MFQLERELAHAHEEIVGNDKEVEKTMFARKLEDQEMKLNLRKEMKEYEEHSPTARRARELEMEELEEPSPVVPAEPSVQDLVKLEAAAELS